jgi:hypothetical protein
LDTRSPRSAGREHASLRCDVAAEDLQKLGVLHQILALLNDARQGAKPIAALIEQLPVLEARVRRAHRSGASLDGAKRDRPPIAAVLATIGNRAFEALLLELLEDLTVLSATLER